MNKKTRKIVFVGLYIALAVVLQYVSGLIPFLQMPNGGNIDLGVIPVLITNSESKVKKFRNGRNLNQYTITCENSKTQSIR